MDTDELTTPRRTCACGKPGVWQHPEDRSWACERHAPKDRARCVVCGSPAAWRHPTDRNWVCIEHMPRPMLRQLRW